MGLLSCKSSGARAQLERVNKRLRLQAIRTWYLYIYRVHTDQMYHVITILHKVHIVLYAQLLYSIMQLWCNAQSL